MEFTSAIHGEGIVKKYKGFELNIPVLDVPQGFATALIGDRIKLIQDMSDKGSDIYKMLAKMDQDEVKNVRAFVDGSTINILADIVCTEVTTIVWNGWSMMCQYVDTYTNPKSPETSLMAKNNVSIYGIGAYLGQHLQTTIITNSKEYDSF